MQVEPWYEIRALILRAQHGDRNAFGRIAEVYEERLLAFVRPLMGPQLQQKVGVDDVVQETCIRALQLIDRFEWRSEPAFWGWLTRVARNTVQKEAGRLQTLKRDVRRETTAEADENQLASDGVSPSRVMRRNERFERLKKALDSLNPLHRRVIFLSHVRGLPTKEVARRLERSPNATSMLLLRAYTKLRAAFGETESLHFEDFHNLDDGHDGAGT